jgi:hypothetical protein
VNHDEVGFLYFRRKARRNKIGRQIIVRAKDTNNEDVVSLRMLPVGMTIKCISVYRYCEGICQHHLLFSAVEVPVLSTRGICLYDIGRHLPARSALKTYFDSTLTVHVLYILEKLTPNSEILEF